MRFIRATFPGLALHASTQMTVTGTGRCEFLERHGVERVVPARELCFKEIRDDTEGRRIWKLNVLYTGHFVTVIPASV